MDIMQIVYLSILQGVTEFLPISSSAHLITLSRIFGWDNQGLLIDISLHAGTLAAVIFFMWDDVISLIKGAFFFLQSGLKQPEARMTFLIGIATIPVIVFGGAAFLTGFENNLRSSLFLIGWCVMSYGLVLHFACKKGLQDKSIKDLNYKDAIMVGLAQVLALIPGVSRSGIVLTATMLLGYKMEDSVKIAFLLSIPTIASASAAGVYEILQIENTQLTFEALVAVAVAFISALITLKAFTKYISKFSILPFVIYRIIMGSLLIALSYF